MDTENRRSRQREGGFTLIELVVVIVILGILAAFAVPRFAAIEVEARSAATTALGGNMRAIAAQAHALWLAQGQPGTLVLDDAPITMVNGYPAEASIDDALPNLEGFLYDETTSPVLFSKTNDGKSAISNCGVTYMAPAALGAAPGISVDTSGC